MLGNRVQPNQVQCRNLNGGEAMFKKGAKSPKAPIMAGTAFVICGLAFAVMLVVFGTRMAHRDHDQTIWMEIAKAGIQLGSLSIIGGGIAVLWRRLESLRAEHRLLNEYRLSLLREVTCSYNEIKAVRRTLRAFGFTSPTDPLTPDQVTEFRAQMKVLNAAQLALERWRREVEVRAKSFHKNEEIKAVLIEAEGYIGEILDEWEKEGVRVVAGASTTAIASMPHLQPFLDKAYKGFKEHAAEPLKRLEELIRELTEGTY
jgi:hypothetical protein